MKMNCVFFSDGVQREMVREVGGGGWKGKRDLQVCDERFGNENYHGIWIGVKVAESYVRRSQWG